MHIFSPGRTIQLDYVAESVSLIRGGSNDLLDILLTNHTPSKSPIDRIHLVYPHAIHLRPSNRGEANRSITDHTWTWADPKSEFNRFYQTQETHLTINNQCGCDEVIVEMPNPNDIAKTLPYTGFLKHRSRPLPYQISGPESILSPEQWTILSQLGWTVFTITFPEPIQFEEARWLRIQCRNGILHQNRMPLPEYWIKKLCGLITHSFEIAGPKDVEHRIVSALRAAGTVTHNESAYTEYRGELLDLQRKLLSQGIQAPDTTTIVKDWRITVFTDYYRKIDEPTFWGDIKPAGGLSNPIKDRNGNVEIVIQWKAGDAIVAPQNKGFFGARIRAHDIPLLPPALPWIAIGISIALNTDKIWRFFNWLWGFFSWLWDLLGKAFA